MEIKNYNELMDILVKILAELGERLQEIEENKIENYSKTVLTQADA